MYFLTNYLSFCVVAVTLLLTRIGAPMLGGKEDPRAAAEGLSILKQSLEVMETVWLQEGYPFLAGCRQPSIADLSLICEIMQLQVRRIACCCYLYILIPCNYTCRTSTSPIFSRKAMRCHVCPVTSQVFEQLLCLLEILSINDFPGISMARLHPHSTQKAHTFLKSLSASDY